MSSYWLTGMILNKWICFLKLGFFNFVLFYRKWATKPEIVDKEGDTDITERAPQEQINHDHLSFVDGTHKNNRSGKFVNVCDFFLCLKAQIKKCIDANMASISFFKCVSFALFFRSVPSTTNFFFLKMLQPSEILFH